MKKVKNKKVSGPSVKALTAVGIVGHTGSRMNLSSRLFHARSRDVPSIRLPCVLLFSSEVRWGGACSPGGSVVREQLIFRRVLL